MVGTVEGHKDGFGFLSPDDGGDDLFLPYREMRMLMHGDRAAGARDRARRARPARGRGGRGARAAHEAGRRAILARGRRRLRVPDNRRISQRVVVPRESAGRARHGDLAVVEIVEQPSRNRDPVGRVLRVLPDGGGADTAIDLAIASHGLSHEFPAEARARGARLRSRGDGGGAAGREDLRRLPLVTIDGEDARDFDDAVWAEENAGGFRLIVAIADVSHYVRPGTALDGEARERATSVYFPNRVLPMLPGGALESPVLADAEGGPAVHGLRHAGAKAGDVSKSRFYPAVMRSAARLTYTQVAARLDRQGRRRER